MLSSRAMTRVPLGHLQWSKTQSWRHAWNLADSAVSTPDLAALGMPDGARLSGSTGSQDALERALGERLHAPGGRVVLTAGASEANAAVYGALLSPGDEVLIESPGYEPLRNVPGVFGARARTFAWLAAPGTLAATVERALSPATRMVVISDQHNPSGTRPDPADLSALAALAQARGFQVLCDETFRDAAERPAGTSAGACPGWIATGSLTKVYGLGSLRIGWIAGTQEMLETGEAGVNALTVNPSLLSIQLAAELLPHLDRLLARSRAILAANREIWAAFVERHPPFRGAPSSSTTTWCVFGADGEGDAFAEFAGRRFDLAIPRGSWFGDSRGVRIALTAEPSRFAATLEVLSAAARAFDWSDATIQEPV